MSQIFRAVRTSLSEPFGSPEHLSFFDDPGWHVGSAAVSSDGTAFYFIKWRHDEIPADIYVSYNKKALEDVAILATKQAIQKKARAIAEINAAMHNETYAYGALRVLLDHDGGGGGGVCDTEKATWRILAAYWHEKQQCRFTVLKSIRELEDALLLLDYEVEPYTLSGDDGDVSGEMLQADINADGRVDFSDYALLMNYWLDSY